MGRGGEGRVGGGWAARSGAGSQSPAARASP